MSFSFEILKNVVASTEGNVFISSASILAAMAIATAGTSSQTEKELSVALSLEGDYEPKHHHVGDLLRSLTSSNLKIVNRLWVNDSYKLNSKYCSFTQDVYDTSIVPLNVSDPQGEAERMNLWVADNTNGKIVDIANPDSITPDLLVSIINAIAYKGSWLKKFDPEATFDGPWKLDNGETVSVPMMHQKMECRYLRSDSAEAVALDLDGDVAMILVKPLTGTTLNQVIDNLSETFVNHILDRYETDVHITLAKWKFEGTYDLIPVFKAMGVVAAFKDGADFSRMTDEAVYISGITHKTFINVDENGAEMAAATKVDCVMECACMPLTFETDESFVYLAVDKKTRTVLFSGRVSDPRVES